MKPCNCGSEKNSWWEYDAKGIPLSRVCEDCRNEKLGRFRKEVLTDANYECDEPVEADY